MADDVVRTQIRRYRRSITPTLPFVPWGLVPLLGLLLLLLASYPFARWQIEAVVRDTARDALRDAGHGWVMADASGQWVTLTGTPPEPPVTAAIEAAVHEATAKTWLGALGPATHVTSQFDAPALCEAPMPTTPAAPTTTSTDWSFRLLAGKLTLTGALPDEATKGRLLAAAQSMLSPPRLASVEDALTISGTELTEPLFELARRGIETVGRCDSGEAAYRSGVFSLRCELSREAEPGVRAAATAPLQTGTLGEITLLVAEEIASCEEALLKILTRSTIEFDTQSAEIKSASNPLLDEVASEAKKCPGTLRVEGHTDNTGKPEFNDWLSQQRAESVRAALIARSLEEARLVAVGFGDRQPIGDNTTKEGRAHNRRIEIKVVRSNE